MKLERFYMMGNGDGEFIICTDKPFVVAKVIRARANDTEMVESFLSDIANRRRLAVKVPGHTIFISHGCYMDKSGWMDATDLKGVLRDMARFYLETKIQESPGAFNRNRESGERWTKEQAANEIARLLQ